MYITASKTQHNYFCICTFCKCNAKLLTSQLFSSITHDSVSFKLFPIHFTDSVSFKLFPIHFTASLSVILKDSHYDMKNSLKITGQLFSIRNYFDSSEKSWKIPELRKNNANLTLCILYSIGHCLNIGISIGSCFFIAITWHPSSVNFSHFKLFLRNHWAN